jgi:hypothetical protein
MALAAVVNQEAFDGLTDEIKKEYKKQSDGMFLLDVTPVSDFALENVKGLKSGLSKERMAREAAEKKLKDFGDLDPDKSRDALTKLEEMANWKPDEKVKEQIEAIKNQLVEKHKGEIGKKDESITSLTNRLKKVLIDSAALQALSTHGSKSAKAHMAYIREHVRLKQIGDEFVVEVFDGDGTALISPEAGSSKPMTIDEFVGQMKTDKEFSFGFDGTGASGSGATNSSGVQRSGGSHTISIADGKDPGKYRAAKAAAEKAGCQLQIADS